ncbi:MAG: hypothetical protein ACSHX8_07245 [Opitutaceae bacterium]
MDHDQSIPEQLSFFDLPEGPGVGPNQARVLLRRRLDVVSHWAPYGQRAGAPRMYQFPGAHEQLRTAPSKLPRCPYFYANQETFGHVSRELGGDAIAQWCFHGDILPTPGCRFWAFSMHRTDWIGSGGIYLEDGLTMASLDKGFYSDFARYQQDAHGLVLVIFTHRMVKRSH